MTESSQAIDVAAEKTSEFQQVVEAVESLSPEAQAVLVDIIQKRLKQRRRDELVQAVKEAEQEYAMGNVSRGSIADLMAELND
jgi:ribonuclease HII